MFKDTEEGQTYYCAKCEYPDSSFFHVCGKEKSKNDNLMVSHDYDLSAWKKLGISRGYWVYFKKEVETSLLDTIWDKINYINTDGGGNGRRIVAEIKDILNNLK